MTPESFATTQLCCHQEDKPSQNYKSNNKNYLTFSTRQHGQARPAGKGVHARGLKGCASTLVVRPFESPCFGARAVFSTLVQLRLWLISIGT